MKQTVADLTQAIESVSSPTTLEVRIQNSPAGLPSAWLDLPDGDILPDIAEALRKIGGRLATMTVYRPEPKTQPELHEVAYHMIMEGVPLTLRVALREGESVPSITPLFPNADWEEREIMELTGVDIRDHPNPKRLFLDESIEAGVYDRYVPYSEMTNLANHEAVWERIRAESCDEYRERRDEDLKGGTAQ